MSGTEFLIASTVVSSIGQRAAGAQAKSAAGYNAALAMMNAKAAKDAAEEKATRETRLGAKRQGTLRSLDPNKLDLLEDSAIEEELNVQTVIHAGDVAAVGHENTARLEIAKGKAAMTGAIIGAAGSALLGGAVAGGFSGSNPTSVANPASRQFQGF